jgi:hypothetical protein
MCKNIFPNMTNYDSYTHDGEHEDAIISGLKLIGERGICQQA